MKPIWHLERELLEKGVLPDLEDVLERVRHFYPTAHMEGSAGLGRMFTVGRNDLAAVTYSSGRYDKNHNLRWRYRIFKNPYPF